MVWVLKEPRVQQSPSHLIYPSSTNPAPPEVIDAGEWEGPRFEEVLIHIGGTTRPDMAARREKLKY